MENEKDSNSGINIASYNQRGGITAHTVNIGKPEPEFTDQMQQKFDEFLAKNLSDHGQTNRITVSALMGDKRRDRLAQKIHSYLKVKGWDISAEVGQMMISNPNEGVRITRSPRDKNLIWIIVGYI